ncbi:Cyanovirin-N [Mycena galopus ATCC 62051]|nr:Cyanovirin-N [Mycena galopus ATCC 62051]
MRSFAILLLLSSAYVYGAAVLGAQSTTISARTDGGFAATCRTLTIFSGSKPFLKAFCANEAGTFVSTTISLNGCVANDAGVMACQQNGGYGASCTTLGFSSGTVLYATCGNGSGGNPDAHLELNNCIGNHNGVLACDF